MKKVLILVGTRPNFIKITQFEKEFAKYEGQFQYILVHTGQHYDDDMSKIFFDQFKLKQPDYYMNIEGLSPAAQMGKIMISLDEIVKKEMPDVILVPGDVNSTLAGAITANKNNILLGHIESGLRSYDREMPEEINRLLTDEITNLYFVTEESGYKNLIEDGRDKNTIHHVGNTMIDTIVAYDEDIQNSDVLEKLSVQKDKFCLMTMHRPRNVDTAEKLNIFVSIVDKISDKIKLVLPLHPRTKNSLYKHNLLSRLENNDNVVLIGALDYLGFQKLIANCKFVLTDSGGIQEETTFRLVPCLTLRDNTERPSTVEEGTNTLVSFKASDVLFYVNQIFDGSYKKGKIPKFWDGKATERMVEILNKIL